ncbi:hypothetical protein [Acinetobacter indicus]|uniref:Glycosyltransferase RgtA/B/C/D-like domain-containing protein n=1 Tax=Acinetobacter indicus CIP 110367 TaxID=1341679 RepID=V2U9R6_9GAMM|nr:hypothetical protein [Acinetobacter indicus]EPF73102.1 hypothetical protein F956_01211 [Acinetobacter indicus ANC 4215]ESK46997.1 hypothetical protein P253_02716 [Acinetobacter indicus CIP 110367]
MRMFERISNKVLFLCVVFLIFIKITFYSLIKNDYLSLGLGGGNDSDYYHDYALGYVDFAVNIWPVILRFFNDFGFYSRDGISYLFLFINLFIIPFLVAKLSGLNFQKNQKYYLYSVLLCLIYPTLFFYTFDIYRDVFMVLSFLVGCLIVKKCLSRSNFISFSSFCILAILMGLFLMALRPYLGYAFLLALALWKIKLTKKRIYLFSFQYLMVLFIANYIGVFERLTEYRSGFEEIDSGSTLGLDFSNPIMFIPNLILSALGQLFGLYVSNPFAIILLLVETVPVFAMLVYVIRNIKLADSFVRFLIIFFVLYASVWLIGNDNLGTAVRLRIYNYLAIYICFFYILVLKDKVKYRQVVNK